MGNKNKTAQKDFSSWAASTYLIFSDLLLKEMLQHAASLVKSIPRAVPAFVLSGCGVVDN